MKTGLLIILMLLSQMAFSETMQEKRIKSEMLTRVDQLTEKISLTRDDLQREDVIEACNKLQEIFVLFPEHVKDIANRMDAFDGKVKKMFQESLVYLMYLHKQSLICKEGKDCEMVDPEAVEKQLKVIEKALKKQRKRIKKGDTGYNNEFHYSYEL